MLLITKHLTQAYAEHGKPGSSPAGCETVWERNPGAMVFSLYTPGLLCVAQEGVTCSEDVLWLMEKGARNRKSAETRMNERSSRSHQVLTVIVDGDNLVTGAQTHGCLHLVDLAGSERTNKSEATGDRLVEANHINSSLSALGDVMAALASKAKHVPFRNSKLTQLLADSLSGQAKVMMFMHIAPEGNSYQETLSTLKFATRVSEITLGQVCALTLPAMEGPYPLSVP
ncbi:kinesin-4 [Haematococcus lacustris]|uniref:Kinesin-4 n=1 Tax=Haematococcus lacustris TaxID=44745 RepID=A0A699Z7Y4_HAELA|nr:kinesin-4 [Haematococcus lacustris]